MKKHTLCSVHIWVCAPTGEEGKEKSSAHEAALRLQSGCWEGQQRPNIVANFGADTEAGFRHRQLPRLLPLRNQARSSPRLVGDKRRPRPRPSAVRGPPPSGSRRRGTPTVRRAHDLHGRRRQRSRRSAPPPPGFDMRSPTQGPLSAIPRPNSSPESRKASGCENAGSTV